VICKLRNACHVNSDFASDARWREGIVQTCKPREPCQKDTPDTFPILKCCQCAATNLGAG
jgi:hypothetical protein